MDNNSGITLSYITKCRLQTSDGKPCPFDLTDAPLNVAIIGRPDSRVQRFIETLMKHAQKKHPEAYALATMQMQFFFAYLILGMYEVKDPALVENRHKFEDNLRRLITPVPVSNDDIEGALGAIGFTMEDPLRQITKGALMHMRDYYEGKIPQEKLDDHKSLLIHP